MKRLVAALCFLAGAVWAKEPAKPMALVGPEYAIKIFQQYVTEPLNYPVEAYPENAPGVEEYQNFAAVIFLEHFPREVSGEEAFWDTGSNLDSVRKYVREGGRIFIFGAAFPRSATGAKDFRNLQFCDDVLGFSRHPQADLVNPVHIQPEGEDVFSATEPLDFVARYTGTVARVTSAEILATVTDESGEEYPFATRNDFGKGHVFYFGTSPFRLLRAARETGDNAEAVVARYGAILQKVLQKN